MAALFLLLFTAGLFVYLQHISVLRSSFYDDFIKYSLPVVILNFLKPMIKLFDRSRNVIHSFHFRFQMNLFAYITIFHQTMWKVIQLNFVDHEINESNICFIHAENKGGLRFTANYPNINIIETIHFFVCIQ